MIAKNAWLGVVALGAAMTLTTSAAAQRSPGAPRAAAPNRPGFAFGTEAGEVLLSVGALVTNTASLLPQRRTDWAPDAPHPHDATVSRWSDATGAYGGAAISIGTGYVLEGGYLTDAGVAHGAGIHALHQSLAEVQAALYTRAVVETLKRLTGRCRPRHFSAGVCTSDVRDAFPSGHTAPVAAIAATRLIPAALATGPAGFRWASFGLGEALALTTAVLRVEAGAHSWSDVVSGFLIGHAIGILVAFAHPMQPVRAGDLASGSSGAALEGGFALHYGGTL